jgi:hypothetical protein
MIMMNIFQRAINAGYSCIPCKGKIPNTNFLPIDKETLKPTWEPYKHDIVTNEIAKKWTGNIAVICGDVSGGLVCIDFDVKNGNKYDDFLIDINNLKPELLGKLYIETTPSGGYHVCYRADTDMRNKKLACNKDGVATIETRGNGGYFICVPSNGYHVYSGKLSTLSTITKEEENLLIAICESLNEYEIPEYKHVSKKEITGDSVFNRYDSVTNPVPILESHGWTVIRCRNDTVYLCRPGKDRGVSACWNHVPNRLYVFSSSTVFEQETLYKPSAIYTILEHNGNYHEAAKELAKNGFGYKKNNAK